MSEGTVEFTNSLYDISVRLTPQARRTIEIGAIEADMLETGGVLIGIYDAEGRVATVTEATTKSSDSAAGRTWFRRGIKGLRQIIRQRWHIGQYYLGEWHSHPGGAPEPSGNDVSEMQAISTDINYQCPKPIMVIVGTFKGDVDLTVSVMDAGRLISLTRT